ncbi:SIR2 family protein [Henriciella sp.]|uniref:SIR2 family protein n=1 Tax=Henriciella sp. TaxID=1968823 RepID=UPI002616E75F|nr:SIR2 family protein [Henriciella sp.]
MSDLNFLKGSRDEFAKLKGESSWEDKAEIIQRQMAEVFGSKNLSLLMGSGCSSLRHEDEELGIPTMKFLAEEFQALLAADAGQTFVNAEQKAKLHEKLGIDLSSDDLKGNLEQMMAVLINAHQFCKTSDKEELNTVAPLVESVIVGIKQFVLFKCTTGPFSNGNNSVVALYRRLYQSLATRARGLAPPWVFTTNYDLFNERAMDRSGIPYSNGFSGTVERRFNPATYRLALAEQLDITSRRWAAVDGFVHFCKLHGSVNWTEEDTGLFPIRESHAPLDPSKDRVMIYPTPSKQTASFGSPYSDMFREFQRQVVQDQSVLVILGFSFGDEHVNNIIFQGLTLPGFRIVAFMDPETNDITRELAALGDPRIWFIWGDGKEARKKAHYFEGVVNHLMPTSADQKIDQTIEKALHTLLAKQQDTEDGQG